MCILCWTELPLPLLQPARDLSCVNPLWKPINACHLIPHTPLELAHRHSPDVFAVCQLQPSVRGILLQGTSCLSPPPRSCVTPFTITSLEAKLVGKQSIPLLCSEKSFKTFLTLTNRTIDYFQDTRKGVGINFAERGVVVRAPCVGPNWHLGDNTGQGVEIWNLISTLLWASCWTVIKLLSCSGPQFPYLQSNGTGPLRFKIWKLGDLIFKLEVSSFKEKATTTKRLGSLARWCSLPRPW